jgi:uncharacterized membrane protein YdbT with pleckstrin-like domain
MGYVEATLAEGETVVYKARFHWLYSLGAWAALLILGIIIVGIVIFFRMMIRKWSTEIAVTNRRLIFKRGWIKRDSEEFALSRIEEINLDQSILGRILNYGRLTLHGTGMGSIQLPTIDDPIAFRRAIDAARQMPRAQTA